MVLPLLYGELTPFYHLVDPLADHAGEAAEFGAVLTKASAKADSLLELGSGAGHSAYYMKSLFSQVVLTDLSAPMLVLSKQLNPLCTHANGDMRTLELGRTFDCIFVHDAISYITTLADLKKVAATVFKHLRTDGAALVVPDCTKESFRDYHEDFAGDDQGKSLRGIMWSHDPDPTDTSHVTDFAFLLRENGETKAVHDRHICGLFSEKQWYSTFKQVGLNVEILSRPLADEYKNSAYTEKMFLCTR